MKYLIVGLALGILDVFTSYSVSTYVWDIEFVSGSSSTVGSLGRGLVVVVGFMVITWILGKIIDRFMAKS